jgi:hypothetical protein
MNESTTRRHLLQAALGIPALSTLFGGLSFGALSFGALSRVALAADLNPEAVTFTLPEDMKFVESPYGGSSSAVIAGDPNKEGSLYVVINKWKPNNMSRPHFHPHDRYITVLSGVWWVGSGTKFDPPSTVAMMPGTVVKHTGGKIHYDGAKSEGCTVQIIGIGPVASTPAEVK